MAVVPAPGCWPSGLPGPDGNPEGSLLKFEVGQDPEVVGREGVAGFDVQDAVAAGAPPRAHQDGVEGAQRDAVQLEGPRAAGPAGPFRAVGQPGEGEEPPARGG